MQSIFPDKVFFIFLSSATKLPAIKNFYGFGVYSCWVVHSCRDYYEKNDGKGVIGFRLHYYSLFIIAF